VFNDGIDFVVVSANDPAIPVGIRNFSGQYRSLESARTMKVGEVEQRVGPHKRHITGHHQQIAGSPCKRFARTEDGVTGSQLLGLLHELNVRQQRPDFVRLVTGDDPHVRRNYSRCAQDVFQQRYAADTVKHFCSSGLHAGPFARSENQDSKVFHKIPD
jgi:hypothetical protein